MFSPADKWHYIFEEKIYGPVSKQQLTQGFEAGSLPPDTPVRAPQFEDWVPAQELPSFRACFEDTSPQPADPGTSPSPSFPGPAAAPGASRLEIDWDTKPRPWRRYVARMLDVTLFIAITGFFLGIILFFHDPIAFIANLTILDTHTAWVGIAWLAAFIPVEAWMLLKWHTTPGKWATGLRVIRADGRSWTWLAALRRCWEVFWRGMGLGIPIVSFIAMVVGYKQLTSKGRAPWDIEHSFDVACVGMTPPRWLALGGMILFLLWVFV